jgi:hypothetical protein
MQLIYTNKNVMAGTTQEAQIRRIVVQSQPKQKVPRDPISKNTFTKIGLVEWFKW